MSDTAASTGSEHRHSHTAMETLQSLIVAFVLAMTFRGFVTEGFVIPTGSMAPTLNGRHIRENAPQTGYAYGIGLNPNQNSVSPGALIDPMLGPEYPRSAADDHPQTARMGDRILVVKSLYPFFTPHRWDVVVFKNPTDPNGEAGNYIKRLIGLPSEVIWLADGDVFAKPKGAEAPFHVQRKPEHVQRAVWQPISDSDYIPLNPQRLADQGTPYRGPPWHADNPAWHLDTRVYTCDTAEPTTLEWNHEARELDDWNPYNQNDRKPAETFVSDLRFRASIVPEQAGLRTSLELQARSHVFEFTVGGGEAIVRYRAGDRDDGGTDWIVRQRASIDDPAPGSPLNIEFWHVDQTMSIFIDGDEVVRLEYDWEPEQRILAATGNDPRVALRDAINDRAERPYITWRFAGSPIAMHRVRVDRDIHYLNHTISGFMHNNEPSPNVDPSLLRLYSPGFGTHLDKLAELGPDHFMMLGDNTQSSSDSRLWGAPHQLVATQIDDAPFVVHRKLILGKAWVVYFPSPMPMKEGDRSPVIPDFGHLRFIR